MAQVVCVQYEVSTEREREREHYSGDCVSSLTVG